MTLSQRIWHVGTAVLLLLLLLSLRLVYWQVVRGDELQPVVLNPLRVGVTDEDRMIKELDAGTLTRLDTLPQPVVQRTQALLANITRGTIYDRNGRALAYETDDAANGRGRVYTEPSLGPVLGYVSGLRLGVMGVERSFNETLLGLDRLDSQVSQLLHQPIMGSDVYLTIDSQIQQAAAESLGNRRGAIVVLDSNGAVLAMVSAPTFDPNRILDPDYAAALVACQAPECQGALLNRATLGLYPPGSTWKTVTLMAALDSGQVTPETVFDFGEPRRGPEGTYYVYEVDGAEIVDPNHPERRLNLVRSFAVSANAAFARMGHEMSPTTFVEYANRLGFGRAEGLPLEIPASPAQLANDPQALYTNNVLRAATAFGQGELLTSPLSMALVVSAVINNGNIPQPHLLLRVEGPDGSARQGEPADNWISSAIRPETAQQVREMMIEVVRNGSGVRAAVSGLTVGGKTGTAEIGGGLPPHAWFAGFAADGERTVIIAVIVENGGEGADVATPIFARVAATALRP